MSTRILLIRTGGTIDAQSYADPKHPPHYVTPLAPADSLVARTIATCANHEQVAIHPWNAAQEAQFVKDGQLYTASDIDMLAEVIRSNPHACFILTHGTDSMAENARLLEEKLAGSKKIVVLTGAMVPLSMQGSDGVETLAFAVAHATVQGAGVHVLGRNSATQQLAFFAPNNVEKDRAASLRHLQFTLTPRS